MNNKAIESLKNVISEQKVVLENGLTVCVCEMTEYSSVYASYGTNYGSDQKRFMLDGKMYDLPDGVAHFLEHKMFENEEGVDAFALYAKTGASANAFTSFDKTHYVFGATDNIDESLDILLSFVSKPYFTDKSVLKEQAIIGQEIKMYDDSPEWRLMFSLLENLYFNCPVRSDIAGTVESISKITKETLYACADAFYRPANMVLSVAGNITLQQVLDACNRADIKTSTKPMQRLTETEPREIRQKFAQFNMEISQPILGIAFKEKPFGLKKEQLKGEIICDILTELIIGDCSDLYCDLYDEGLINPGFSGEYLLGDQYLAIFFSGETKDPETVEKAIRAAIGEMREDGIDEEAFICIKNILYGEMLSGLERTETVAMEMSAAHMQGVERFDEAEILAKLTVEDLQQALKDMLQEEYSVTVHLLPNTEV